MDELPILQSWIKYGRCAQFALIATKMLFIDITLITEDVLNLVGFYDELFGISIEENDAHTQFEVGSLGITLYSQRAAESDMGFDFKQYNGTGKMTIGFNLDEIDSEVLKLKELGVEFVAGTKTYPWVKISAFKRS